MRMNKQELEALRNWVESVADAKIDRQTEHHNSFITLKEVECEEAWEKFEALMTRSPIEPQINEQTTEKE